MGSNRLKEINEKSTEFVVQEYFRRIKSGDIQSLLDLFSDDCVIHEPFSKCKRLTGKSEAESFFRTVIMANDGVQSDVKIERDLTRKKSVVAVIIFHKGASLKARFRFEFEDSKQLKLSGRIKTLYIEFID